MWEKFKNTILNLFGFLIDGLKQKKQEAWATSYESIEKVNFTAIIANKLATLSTTDSDINVQGDNKRANFINASMQELFLSAKTFTSGALGYGGVVLVPYLTGGEILFDIIPQDRCYIAEKRGKEVTRCIILSDSILRNQKNYARWTDYSLEGDTYVIRNRATVNNNICNLDTISEWASIPDEIKIPNVGKLLIAFLRCPTDSRLTDSLDGVPITYGQEELLKDIQDTLAEETKEYILKRAFVGVEASLFDKDDKLPKSGLFKKFLSDRADADLWKEYSPEIRHVAYSARLQAKFELLEKAIGTSKGILTTPDTVATATEVRRSQHDTWSLVGNIRTQIEMAIKDAAFAVDKLCNYYSLTPAGEYTISFSWDLSLLEDSSETWQQMKDGYSMGVLSKAEIRAWQTGESIEDAQDAVDEIQASDPRMNNVL